MNVEFSFCLIIFISSISLMKPCQVDWQKLVNTEILFCYTPNEAMSG